jgi:hypothetical protein
VTHSVTSIDIHELQVSGRSPGEDNRLIELGAEPIPVMHSHADVMEAKQVLI